jgi:hypothetical protein
VTIRIDRPSTEIVLGAGSAVACHDVKLIGRPREASIVKQTTAAIFRIIPPSMRQTRGS